MVKEFRKLAIRGSVLDVAIAVIIGGAFDKIITSFVNDLLAPIIGALVGGLDLSGFFIALNGLPYGRLQAARDAGAPVLAYGVFITTVLDFIVTAMIILMIVRALNGIHSEPEAASSEITLPSKEELLLIEIRDLLKQQADKPTKKGSKKSR